MATLRSSLSRSLLSAARSSLRSSPPLRRPPSLPRRRPLAFSPHRSLPGELGAVHSLLPVHSAVAEARLTSHLSANARACCELSQGTFCRTCQDR